jgi:hypothetical protein
MEIKRASTGQPLLRSSLLEDHIGLGWVNFQVMRRTHARLGHKAKVDPKVAADQRGHGIGAALDVYTKSSIEERAVAANQLEEAVLTKVVQMPKNGGLWRVCFYDVANLLKMERETGFEPATSSLGSYATL